MAVRCHVEVGLHRNITCHSPLLASSLPPMRHILPPPPEPLPEAHPTATCLPSNDAHSTLRPATRLQQGLKFSGDTPLPNLPPMRPATPRQPLVAQLTSNEACNPTTTCCLPRHPPPAYTIPLQCW
jgi:hypothetical protein